ncbi:MAG: DUF4230 domain-containing protein [Nocardioides sp.]|uniref:DUF4230 domain-containing protein n=1 Tax=Nocardioides sp. TaxID=35761 RepID=UPI00238A96D9|nr:DUF4230 domain-containing protein [Nocardioides sp.]MDE0777749.1 DUF4230 domain-containing protein [Nocardioides sp.]
MTSLGRTLSGLVVAMAAVIVAFVAIAGSGLLLGIFSNPFAVETVDRTGPSVLESLSDLSEYHAASAHYETVVDIERDTGFVPSFISGERVIYVGKGDVDAVVDFGQLDERAVALSNDGTSVTVTLPAPQADDPVLDLENSYVANRDEGIIDKFAGSDLELEAQLKAVEQMTAAVANEGMLVDRAKENTEAMLRGLFRSLGYTRITVNFDEDVT